MPTPNTATNPSGSASNPSNAKNPGPAANRNRPSEPEDLADAIDEIRAEINALTASITNAAGDQLAQVQAKAKESIQQNPFTAVAIGAALGFLYGVLRR